MLSIISAVGVFPRKFQDTSAGHVAAKGVADALVRQGAPWAEVQTEYDAIYHADVTCCAVGCCG